MGHSSTSEPGRPRHGSPHPRNGSIRMFGPVVQALDYKNDPIALERDLRSFFLARRPVSVDRLGRQYPETTVMEIRQVVSLLYDESRHYVDKRRVSWRDTFLFGPWAHAANELGRDDDYAGHADAVKRFADYHKALRSETDGLLSWEPYAKNAIAWDECRRLALKLGVAADNPIPEADGLHSLAYGAKELPNTLRKAAAAVADAALAPVRRDVGALLRALAVPAAIGGAAVLGVVLLTRGPSREREASS